MGWHSFWRSILRFYEILIKQLGIYAIANIFWKLVYYLMKTQVHENLITPKGTIKKELLSTTICADEKWASFWQISLQIK